MRVQHVPASQGKAPPSRSWRRLGALVGVALLIACAIAAVVIAVVKLGPKSSNPSSPGTAAAHHAHGQCSTSCSDLSLCPANVTLPATAPLPLPELTPEARGASPWFISTDISRQPLSVVTFDNQSAIRVNYTQGLWGVQSGASFESNPFGALPAESAVLSYSVYFPPDFSWMRGGKLPGLCIGESVGDCATGGDWKPTAGSVRLMWRQDGAAIGYVYLPLQISPDGTSAGTFGVEGQAYQQVADTTGATGQGLYCINSGGLQLQAGQWNNITVVVVMSTPNATDGVISVTVNEVTRTVNDVLWRTSPQIKVSTVVFATFFGGNDASWAAPAPTYALFRNFRFAAPANLNQSTLVS